MKFDVSMARAVLLEYASAQEGVLPRAAISEAFHPNSKEALYHVQVMSDDRQVEGKNQRFLTPLNDEAHMITRAGKEFLEPIKDDAVWNETLEALQFGGSSTIELVTAAAKAVQNRQARGEEQDEK